MIRKLLTGSLVAAVAFVATAGVAFAHVEIERNGAVGADGMVAATLTVPNEETTSGTVKIQLVFPAAPKITTATATAVNGWTATVEKSGAGAVTQITWVGGPLTGTNKVELPLSLGPVSGDVKTMEFKAVQTYEDGTEVRWIEPTPASGVEPEHPAPVLTVRGTATGHDDADTSHHDDDSGLSTGAIAAIVVAVIVVGAGIGYVVVRARRRG
jgi:uncharacterized protein YcnI